MWYLILWLAAPVNGEYNPQNPSYQFASKESTAVVISLRTKDICLQTLTRLQGKAPNFRGLCQSSTLVRN